MDALCVTQGRSFQCRPGCITMRTGYTTMTLRVALNISLFFLCSFLIGCEPNTKRPQREKEAPSSASTGSNPTTKKSADQPKPLDSSLITPKGSPELLQKLSEDIAPGSMQSAPQVSPESIPRAGLPKDLPAFAGVKETGYRVSYVASKSPYFDSIRQVMEQQKLFEAVAESLNNTFNLPRIIDVQLTDCGAVNAYYDPRSYRLIMCYEMIGSFIEVFRPITKSDTELFTSVFGGVFFVFLHEAGHSLVHLFEIPITGREEDAVDQLATIVLLMGGDDGVHGALAAAQRFYLSGEEALAKGLPFWDEHSLGQQRFYNIACLVYGSNPEKYAGLVAEDLLPPSRARRCPEEFTTASNSWVKLLKPHLREETTSAPTSIKKGDPAACEKTSDHVINLMMSEASKEFAALSKEEASQARSELLDRVLTLSQEMTLVCVDEGWSTEMRDCIRSTITIKDAEACMAKPE
jgi:hypothetical protein